eukprot:CAMPEP_0172486434 /NCGR_PEP_ID=MMETSP1066-20121228/15026_1 /TAXON_ID=671091 /ORGANISM="Coscinodiscus wailesii, Strain CCMP2513" /LENGTH=50 /DNA_ID=CAMNT_0013252403 /DNA_START=95 /DNA_END=244 /DNA_ORIENTATION=+
MKLSVAALIASVGSAAAWSTPSGFTGSALKAAPKSSASMTMSTGMGVNGF